MDIVKISRVTTCLDHVSSTTGIGSFIKLPVLKIAT